LAHVQHDAEAIPLFKSANIKRLNLGRMSSAECVTLAKNQGKQVAKLGSNDHVYYGNMPVP